MTDIKLKINSDPISVNEKVADEILTSKKGWEISAYVHMYEKGMDTMYTIKIPCKWEKADVR